MKKLTVHKLTATAAIAAVYAVLTVALGFMSYGSVQFRISEAMCILPFFFPQTTWGLFIGCILANMFSPSGMADMIFGSLASLIACLLIGFIGRKCRHSGWGGEIAACLMPVVVNAVIIGALIAYFTAGEGGGSFVPLFFANAASVGFGEAVVMFVLGLPLMRILPGKKYFERLGEVFK